MFDFNGGDTASDELATGGLMVGGFIADGALVAVVGDGGAGS